MTAPPVRVGDVLHLDVQDYCYGAGPLVLRVTEVGGVETHNGKPWIYLRGVPATPRGDGPERGATVRLAALLLPEGAR